MVVMKAVWGTKLEPRWKGSDLRKPTVVVAVAIAATLLACAVSGCNSEEKKVREYLNSAYEKSKVVTENQVKFEEMGQDLIEYYDGLVDITPESIQQLDEYFSGMAEIMAAIGAAAEQTKAEYEKVLGLKGIEKYKEYAENRIEAIGLVNKWVEQLKKFYDIFKRSFDESMAGKIQDENAIMEEIGPILEERDRIEVEIERLNDEAADLREELDVD